MRLAAGLLLLGATFVAGCGRSPYPRRFVVERNLHYLPYQSTVVDVIASAGGSGALRPIAILVHGGAWLDGRKEEIADLLCAPFAVAGFVVANVEYRQSAEAPAPAAVTDVLAASHWVLDNAVRWKADRRRAAIVGVSAGGHLALMAALGERAAPVRAVVNLAGITDVADLLEGAHRQAFAARWLPSDSGRSELARRLSPITYVHPGAPPVLTIHSVLDNVVPYSQASALTEALRRAGNVAELITLDAPGHGFSVDLLRPLMPEIFAFLARSGVQP
jgi:acetyl esterase/lipase